MLGKGQRTEGWNFCRLGVHVEFNSKADFVWTAFGWIEYLQQLGSTWLLTAWSSEQDQNQGCAVTKYCCGKTSTICVIVGAQSLSLQYQCPFLPPGESWKANFLGDVHQIPKHFTDLGTWWLYDGWRQLHTIDQCKSSADDWVLQIWSRGYNTMINCCEKEWGPATKIFRHINDMSLRAVERNCASFNTLISCHGQVGMGVWARWQLPFGMHGTVIEAKDPWPKHITFSILNSGL